MQARIRTAVCFVRCLTAAAIGLASIATTATAGAQFPSTEADPHALQIHAFVSQGFLKTSHNDYLGSSERGSFEFTEVGVNFTKSITDDLRAGVQLFAYELGPLGNYEPRFDWFYLDYRFRDWFGIRAGRTKIPFGLYNESSDVDAARVPVLLPQSVYPIDNRDYLLAQTGGEIYGNVDLGPAGGLEYRGYGGTIKLDFPAPANGISIEDVEVPYLVGGRLMWAPPLEGLQVGASAQALRVDLTYRFDPAVEAALEKQGVIPPGLGGTLPTKLRVNLWVGSAEYQRDNLQVAAEYSRWILNIDSPAPTALRPHVVNERYYGMISYRMAPWFTPGAYYSAYYPDVQNRGARGEHQHDTAVTMRYDINTHWLFKIEGHWMNGTAALNPALNDGKDRNTLPKNWGLLVVKTTAYF